MWEQAARTGEHMADLEQDRADDTNSTEDDDGFEAGFAALAE
jgi:hypothetical protein